MSHRRKRRQPEPKKRPFDGIREHPRATVAVVVFVVLLVSLGVLVATTGPPLDYNRCETPGAQVQHIHYRVLIQLGERMGGFNLLFVRVPENMGIRPSCMYPVHTHGDTPGERTQYYVTVHVESRYSHGYTLGDFFYTWGKWSGYPHGVYFGSDGVSYYRSSNVEVWLRYGPVIDPANENYTRSALALGYQNYVPQDGDYVEIIVHEPYTTLDCPYYPYSDPAGPACGLG